MTLGVIARLTIKEGKNDEFEAVFKEMVAAVRANEPGCHFYDLHRSKDDAQAYIVLE
ncbi:MAG: quinol monooxygenase YgiN [Paraglaciecola psychrophila]|jgi:quinol monooxygenase YgiN